MFESLDLSGLKSRVGDLGLGFGAWGVGFRVEFFSKFMVWDLGFGISGLRYRVWGFGV